METEAMIKPQLSIINRLFPAILPVIIIAITYIDPGKWVATIESGARCGYDLITIMFIFSLAAGLCQYLSACISVVTGRNLAQICSSEYDRITCIFLGIQAELSMIALDLSMILGIAHGLNLLFGMSLFVCVFLTSLDAFLYPVFSGLLETGKAKFMCLCFASFALISYFFGVLMSQPDTSLSVDGVQMKLSGESVFALMSLLGASIMPHNFYLHSSIVQCLMSQQNPRPTYASKGALCHDHLFAIFTVFTAIFVINYLLMNSAANVFYSTGLDLLTFQDALSLMDQVFRTLIGPLALILILSLSHHTSSLTWKFSGQPVVHNFFKLETPGWVHHSTIRLIAIIPALLCSWHSGSEGTYQLLIFTQIMVALLLPSSVIPLFRVAASRSVMGVNKISTVFEFLVLITFMGMLGASVIFVVELVFGNSDWASNVRWNGGGLGFAPFAVLLVIAFFSISLMLWLVVTPLQSASFQPDSGPELGRKVEFLPEYSRKPEFPPEEIGESEKVAGLMTIKEHSPSLEEPVTAISGGKNDEESKSVEKTLRIDGNSEVVKDVWSPEELPEKAPEMETNQLLPPDGPPLFRSLAGKLDDSGGGAGSLTKLGGLGRAARRQLAAVLDEFWGQLFDFHGEPTQEAKTRKLDKLLGIDSKVNPKASKVESQTSIDLNLNYGLHRGPNPGSLLSSQMQLYGQRSSLSPMDPDEKRYHSLRVQSLSGGPRIPQVSSPYDDQPATVHGYQIKSYMNQIEPLAPKSPSIGSPNFNGPYSLTKGLQNGSSPSPAKPPGFPDPVMARNGSMQPERLYYNNIPAENMHSNVNEKKYYSMPDISGLSLPHRDGTLGRKMIYSGQSYRSRTPSGYAGLYSGSDTWSMWSRQPFEQFGVAEKSNKGRLTLNGQETGSGVDLEANVLKSFRLCIMKLLKLEGSDWLFNQNSGLDEDLVDQVAARERFLYEVEVKEMNRAVHVGESGSKIELVTSIPNCGDGCVWRADLITSFGVWCIHRVLELSLMESRPELWGKYTYVLNRLQGIIELAFSKPRAAMTPCFCLQLPSSYHHQKASPPKSTASLPPPAKQSRGKCTTAASLLDIVKDVEIAISCRKGRTGTTAGDVAFPKGKENLASVLKRYKRRLSNKPQVVGPDGLTGARKSMLSSPYGLQ